mmetsp:Transcript_18397/g.46603  ORF Transcript_18397/g.46603 Transcript_18397/m.46603 type:complete len:94 (+) Transcript_18397:142-423(+)
MQDLTMGRKGCIQTPTPSSWWKATDHSFKAGAIAGLGDQLTLSVDDADTRHDRKLGPKPRKTSDEEDQDEDKDEENEEEEEGDDYASFAVRIR